MYVCMFLVALYTVLYFICMYYPVLCNLKELDKLIIKFQYCFNKLINSKYLIR